MQAIILDEACTRVSLSVDDSEDEVIHKISWDFISMSANAFYKLPQWQTLIFNYKRILSFHLFYNFLR